MDERSRLRAVAGLGISSVVLALGMTACGGSDDAEQPELSAIAAEGREIANSNGCAACHGKNGGGGVGPAFVGLAGSDVPLADGSSVVATDEYLAESITNPGAKKVDEFSANMPENRLSGEQVEKVVAYIKELK